MNFIPDPNPENLTRFEMPRNVLSLEAFTSNSVLSPVVGSLPCPYCGGQGIVGDDQDNEDCPACSGTGDVSIRHYDDIVAYIEDRTAV